ncbi:NitT/TauT family transport system substrate-binding protein [Methylopila capsulata]|uniref:NitT/TauT family transport system substrate-binding protein n=1 Tax=Methylopila capsulata TaxID=61654 RepID=A0ABS2T1U5_9HYPH|nr:ABC transporter substrate-binding protein [Methylopila capsulata]MBM7850130.1 NitT/TauT family transport system substrate-binding protein [Methylopila capsulata]
MPALSRRSALIGAGALGVALGAGLGPVLAARPLRLVTLKFGTVNWLLDTVAAEGLDVREGVTLQRTQLASTQALTVALQANDADLVVSDWTWAMRRRADGEKVQFAPYSSALGALVVGKDSTINALADLKGKKLGVAGGPLDKSWLLLRARAHDLVGGDIATMLEPVFGAPPLLSEQLRLGRIDAVLTYWQFAARLDAEGFRKLTDVTQLMGELGVTPPPPLVGFVWREELANTEPKALSGFFRAVDAANQILKSSDAAWDRLKPAMQVSSDAEFTRLREYFRAGVPGPWTEAQLASSKKLYELLADLGGADVVGANPRFDPALFWSPKA